jgi:hypothetical protein
MKTYTAASLIILAIVGGWYLTKQDTLQLKQPIPEGWSLYTNNELGYSIQYPKDWIVDEYALDESVSVAREVTITPPEAEPFVGYLSMGIDPRPLDLIRYVYNSEEDRPFTEQEIEFADKKAFRYSIDYREYGEEGMSVYIYIPYKGKIYWVASGRYDLQEVQQAIASFQLI